MEKRLSYPVQHREALRTLAKPIAGNQRQALAAGLAAEAILLP